MKRFVPLFAILFSLIIVMDVQGQLLRRRRGGGNCGANGCGTDSCGSNSCGASGCNANRSSVPPDSGQGSSLSVADSNVSTVAATTRTGSQRASRVAQSSPIAQEKKVAGLRWEISQERLASRRNVIPNLSLAVRDSSIVTLPDIGSSLPDINDVIPSRGAMSQIEVASAGNYSRLPLLP